MGHLALSPSSRLLAVPKPECDDVDDGLDYIRHFQRPPDSETSSMENIMWAISYQAHGGYLQHIFVN